MSTAPAGKSQACVSQACVSQACASQAWGWHARGGGRETLAARTDEAFNRSSLPPYSPSPSPRTNPILDCQIACHATHANTLGADEHRFVRIRPALREVLGEFVASLERPAPGISSVLVCSGARLPSVGRPCSPPPVSRRGYARTEALRPSEPEAIAGKAPPRLLVACTDRPSRERGGPAKEGPRGPGFTAVSRGSVGSRLHRRPGVLEESIELLPDDFALPPSLFFFRSRLGKQPSTPRREEQFRSAIPSRTLPLR